MLITSLLLSPVALVAAQPGGPWWGGSAPCAHGCLQSAWNSNQWPAPSSFCNGGGPVSSCLQNSCQATPAAYQSFSLLSSSICSQYASCTAAGSTGVYTITANGPWGGGGGGPGHPGPNGGGPGRGPWGTGGTWGPGVYTVTGCPYNGSPWFNTVAGQGWNGWGPTGTGWSWYTQLQTVTTVWVSNGVQVTATGVATVAEAVSGGFTSVTTYGVGPTGVNAAPPRVTGDVGVKVMGAVLGGAAVVVGML